MKKGCVISHRALAACLLVLLCTLMPARAHGQIIEEQREPGPTTPVQKPKEQQQDESLETFKVQVNVVSLLFNVKDKHGALLPQLTKDDFDLYEDGELQKIKYFSADSQLPLTLGILIDTSGSQQRVLPMEQEAGVQFLREVLRPKDLAFLINFDVNVELVQDYTNSIPDLRDSMNHVRINVGMGGGTPGLGGGPIPTSNPRGTLLYDAIYLASHDKLQAEVGRKAVIILTDGEDQGSRLKIADAIEAAQKSDVMAYVILIADRGGAYNGFGEGEMKRLCEQTGGRVIDVGDDPSRLKKAFDQIGEELRSQYSIGYTPTNSKHDGSYRKVEIKPKTKNVKIQARKGYYAVRD